MGAARTFRDTDRRIHSLADFRYTLRRFLHFSEEAAARAGLTPQQHQLLLQIAGAAPGTATTVGYLAERLVLRHHSMVELAGRCEEAGLIVRRQDDDDRRVVLLELTSSGRRILDKLSEDHACELHELAPGLIDALTALTSLRPKDK